MGISTLLQQQANELSEAIEQLSEQHAWALARGYKELARAYLVGQTELLRRMGDVQALISLIEIDDEQ